MEFCTEKLKDTIRKNMELFINIRRDLNRLAELSYEEFKTQKYITERLSEWGIENFPTAKTGVIGIINRSDECIGIRSDMDAI